MLSRYNANRTMGDNLKLGVLTAFTAGMTNVASLVLFFSFTSNVTGHFAILAEEIAKGKWYQVVIVFLWVLLFMAGSFLSNAVVIHGDRRRRILNHAIPIALEAICLVAVGWYGQHHYRETLMETEVLVALLLFAMGLQNGLTASISNFSVKTTHLTGLVTDLAIHLSMATKRHWRERPEVRDRIVLLTSIAASYLAGGVLAGSIVHWAHAKVFYFIAAVLLGILAYDLINARLDRHARTTRPRTRARAALAPERSRPGPVRLRRPRPEEELDPVR